MTATYGVFDEVACLDGESFPAEQVDRSYAERAGFEKILALRGLPNRHIDSLIRASQVSDVPHTWRIKESLSEDEVSAETIALGREVLKRDVDELGSHIITYIGGHGSGVDSFVFLAAGAIRDRLTRAFHDEAFPVVSRAIVAPAWRGKGIGSLIVEHRFKAALRFFSTPPKAIHFGTESEKILHSLKKVERDERIRFVHVGNESYSAMDGTHSVHDFLCFLPSYQKLLLDAVNVLSVEGKKGETTALTSKLERFMNEGVGAVRRAELQDAFIRLRNMAPRNEAAKKASFAIEEVFSVLDAIGAKDPT